MKRTDLALSPKTTIAFRFRKAGGFNIGYIDGTGAWKGWGNFNPRIIKVLLRESKDVIGNVWGQGYDFNHVYKIDLSSEEPRQLPAHILNNSDEMVRMAYKTRQAEVAANVHEINNGIRQQLAYYEDTGLIEIVGDTFLDSVNAESVTSVKAPEPDAATHVDAVGLTVDAVTTIAPMPKKRGRPPKVKTPT